MEATPGLDGTPARTGQRRGVRRPEGRFRQPERISHLFREQQQRCVRALGEDAPPFIRLHDLRHTHATILVRDRENVKVVSERLGHASVTVTLTTCSHVIRAISGTPRPVSPSLWRAGRDRHPSGISVVSGADFEPDSCQPQAFYLRHRNLTEEAVTEP
jgi:hypothetical protein